MAFLYKEIFKDMLALLPNSWELAAFDNINTERYIDVLSNLPSPEELKGKIIVKSKRIRTSVNSLVIQQTTTNNPNNGINSSGLVGTQEQGQQLVNILIPPTNTQETKEKDVDILNEKIANELSEVSYLSGIKFKHLNGNKSGIIN